MNVRCGIDIVDVSRFVKKIEDNNQAFIDKCFTEAEIEYCNSIKDLNRKAERYAARYAAKRGTPSIKLTGGALEHANALGMSSVSLSLSHDGGMAIAYCVMLVDK